MAYHLVSLTGWIALLAFILMLATCVCLYKPQCRLTGKTKTRCDDYLVSKMHQLHKWFVILAVLAIAVHVTLAVT